MDWIVVTRWVIIITIIVLSVYDVFVISKHGVETSISRVILKWAQKYPIIAFALGVLFGHLFWLNCP